MFLLNIDSNLRKIVPMCAMLINQMILFSPPSSPLSEQKNLTLFQIESSFELSSNFNGIRSFAYIQSASKKDNIHERTLRTVGLLSSSYVNIRLTYNVMI